ncbi:MAG: GAF domain-containing sensor histidine kinase [Nitriliruptorales bacterium]|nr:GAF domain-containing sensor histidine kinase [Nitriliruptorales bacterium]
MASDPPLRIATAAFTQAVVGQHDPGALAALAGGEADVLRQATDHLDRIALGDREARRTAHLLLELAVADTVDGDVGNHPGQALDDPGRLTALGRSGLLEETHEEAFDRATRLASRALGTPVALVSVVDRDRQFFKSETGLPEPWASRRQTPLTHSFCRYVVESGQALAVSDARQHPLVADNAAVDDLDVTAYLGLPIGDDDGNVLGSFCVISHEPRQWTADDRRLLADVAAGVVRELRLRRSAADLHAQVESANASMAMLAHDLRAPLSVIQQSIETVGRLASSDLPVEDVIEVANRQVRRLAGLAQALLQSQGSELPVETVALREMVDQLVSDGLLGDVRDGRLRIEIPPQLEVLAPSVLVEQIVLNLVVNALKHTDGAVTVGATEDDGEVVITVADEGAGIRHELAELLRPYRRGQTSEDGHGLGLSLVSHFVERLAGRLDVDAADGTVFRVAIPATAS